ncbi:MAG: hypothetical protein ACK5AZ_23770 [Bryobacteraceae bacterium]
MDTVHQGRFARSLDKLRISEFTKSRATQVTLATRIGVLTPKLPYIRWAGVTSAIGGP